MLWNNHRDEVAVKQFAEKVCKLSEKSVMSIPPETTPSKCTPAAKILHAGNFVFCIYNISFPMQLFQMVSIKKLWLLRFFLPQQLPNCHAIMHQILLLAALLCRQLIKNRLSRERANPSRMMMAQNRKRQCSKSPQIFAMRRRVSSCSVPSMNDNNMPTRYTVTAFIDEERLYIHWSAF